MLAWEEIMQKCPTMKEIVERKITEEMAVKEQEINELKLQLQLTQQALDELILGGM